MRCNIKTQHIWDRIWEWITLPRFPFCLRLIGIWNKWRYIFILYQCTMNHWHNKWQNYALYLLSLIQYTRCIHSVSDDVLIHDIWSKKVNFCPERHNPQYSIFLFFFLDDTVTLFFFLPVFYFYGKIIISFIKFHLIFLCCLMTIG